MTTGGESEPSEALQQRSWRLDASKELVLSDVHIGCAASSAEGLHTTVLRLRCQPADASSAYALAGVCAHLAMLLPSRKVDLSFFSGLSR